MTNKSVDIVSNKLIDVLKNIAILTVTSPTVIKVPIRGFSAIETTNSFALWLAKFKYQKTCLKTVSIAILGKVP